MLKKKLAIIGCGNMGQAFAEGILKARVFRATDVIVTDASRQKLEAMKIKWKVNGTQDNTKAVKQADIILLAVKPQHMSEVLVSFKDSLKPHELILSIAAGYSISSIEKQLGSKRFPIVRIMPNLAAKVGMSISAWIGNSHVTKAQKGIVQTILSAVGEQMEVKSEDMLNSVTAVSGSGPAYVFYFVEALIQSAVQLGFSPKEAELLVHHTLYGATGLLKDSTLGAQGLRSAVTSKGGTTEAAIAHLEKENFSRIIHEALVQAKKRANELRS